MVNIEKVDLKKIRVVSSLMLSIPVVYIFVILFLPRQQCGYSPVQVYIFVILAIISVMLSNFMKEIVWNKRKKNIKTADDFYAAYLATTSIAMAFMGAVGACGVVLYLVSRNFMLFIALIVVSFIGLIIYFPRRSAIDERKKEFSFKID